MGTFIDLTGKKFGRLTVLRRIGRNKYKQIIWQVKCDCGNIREVQGENLRKGESRSCGCLQHDLWMKHCKKYEGPYSKRLNAIWHGMKDRCYIENHDSYSRYGGRGITVCPEWLNNYAIFRDWAFSHGYADNLTIDRIDNDKGYSPDNCRWITMKEQHNNKSTNRLITYNGITKTSSQWAEHIGITKGAFYQRLRKWHDIEKAITYNGNL